MDITGGNPGGLPATPARPARRRSFADLLRLSAAIFLTSLASAVLIDRARERIDTYTLKAHHATQLIEINRNRATAAAKVAREAELNGDRQTAIRYLDEADGRAKLAEYHRTLAELYLTRGVQFWRPIPIEPSPPSVRLIPDRFPGAGRGARLAGRAPEPTRGP